jgi:hypothetical protein
VVVAVKVRYLKLWMPCRSDAKMACVVAIKSRAPAKSLKPSHGGLVRWSGANCDIGGGADIPVGQEQLNCRLRSSDSSNQLQLQESKKQKRTSLVSVHGGSSKRMDARACSCKEKRGWCTFL